jgi:hypothetical protein
LALVAILAGPDAPPLQRTVALVTSFAVVCLFAVQTVLHLPWCVLDHQRARVTTAPIRAAIEDGASTIALSAPQYSLEAMLDFFVDPWGAYALTYHGLVRDPHEQLDPGSNRRIVTPSDDPDRYVDWAKGQRASGVVHFVTACAVEQNALDNYLSMDCLEIQQSDCMRLWRCPQL